MTITNRQRIPLRQHDFCRLEDRNLLATLISGLQVDGSIGSGGSETFELQASAGDQVLIQVGDRDPIFSNREPDLFVTGPGVSPFSRTDTGDDAAIVQFEAPGTGTYFVTVRDAGNDQPLNFRIRSLVLPELPVLDSVHDEFLQNGEEKVGTVQIGSFAIYPFEANAGDFTLVRAGITNTASTGKQPQLLIFDPAGTLTHTDSGSVSAQASFFTPTTGTYTAVVRDLDSDATLNFRIRAVTVPGDPIMIAGQDKTLQNGEQINATVPLGSFSVFPLELQSGQLATITVEDRDPAFSDREPVVSLISPSGALVAAESAEDDLTFLHTPSVSGTYTAIVSDLDNDSLLNFSIHVDGVSQVTARATSFLRNGENVERPDVLQRPDLLDTLEITFNQAVAIDKNDLVLRNESLGGAIIDLSNASFSYSGSDFRATWDFSGPSFGSLQPGYYSATLVSSGVSSVSSGSTLDGDSNGAAGGDVSRDFYLAIPGDANLDGKVDITDIEISMGVLTNNGDASILLTNLGEPIGQRWRDGDFNADGDVDISEIVVTPVFANVGDASILLANLGTSVSSAVAFVSPLSVSAFESGPSTELMNDEHFALKLDAPTISNLASDQDLDVAFSSLDRVTESGDGSSIETWTSDQLIADELDRFEAWVK